MYSYRCVHFFRAGLRMTSLCMAARPGAVVKTLSSGYFYMCCSCRFFAAVFGGGPYSAWAVIPPLMTFFSDQIFIIHTCIYVHKIILTFL